MSQTKRKKAFTKFLAFGATPLIIFTGVLVYPFMQGLFLTFTDWDGLQLTKTQFSFNSGLRVVVKAPEIFGWAKIKTPPFVKL